MNTNRSIFTRRQALQSTGAGLGMLALANLLGQDASGSAMPMGVEPHFQPKAKRIIHLFMNGGPFQCDLFDPKPKMAAMQSFLTQSKPLIPQP